ncbi:MAG TPA: c-type cytochrome, partial [Bacteroidales bacterium]
EAYNREPDHYVIARALATFERSIISGNSPYDQYFFQNKKTALSFQEIAGMELFNSEKTNCFSCHSGFNFSNYSFQNNGLYQEYADMGRFKLTNIETDRALFKVPSLRNVGVTGPYMHDGSMKTLKEVVAHYNSGGKNHPHKNEMIKPLNLTEAEQAALIAFLRSLTDYDFVNNKKFRP